MRSLTYRQLCTKARLARFVVTDLNVLIQGKEILSFYVLATVHKDYFDPPYFHIFQ